jgi:FkbM family methyltransferase
MTSILQRLLLAVYARVKALGFLDSRPGKWIFRRAYFAYKRWLESTPLALRGYVEPGSWVVDVGANLGFYTLLFSRWISGAGKIVSIEPAAENYAELESMIASEGLSGKVIAVQAVASEVDGHLRLKLNPESHADHRIANNGVATTSVRLDSLLAQHGKPRVSLVKIDVQGAEPRVLLGSLGTLREFAPAIYMEVDDRALRESGSSAAVLIDWMRGLGYSAYAVKGKNISRILSMEEISTMLDKLGYADFLFLSANRPAVDAATQHSPM